DFHPLFSFAYGAGAPSMTSKRELLALHDGEQWTTKPAPWKSAVELTRLSDGTTLGLEQEAWLISPGGEISPLRLEQSHAESTVEIGGDAWILGDYRLSKPSAPGRFKVAQLPARTSSGHAPAPPG